MITLPSISLETRQIRAIVLFIAAITFVYFVPALSHLIGFPLYLVEPMRIMLILAMVHTTKRNAYLLAITLPLFSWLVSGHPVLFKMGIIAAELVLNVWLFYFLANRFKNRPVAILLSIVLSKGVYYLMKFGLLSAALLEGSLVSTPLYFQAIITLIFTGYIFLWSRAEK
ncbi:MAG TPA: hypothetical protein VLH16_07670 [Bacteroidales bacterium]|nr:hypothetical protein [Bacteroidales bacterium]